MNILTKIALCLMVFIQAMMVIAMKEAYGYFGASVLLLSIVAINFIILWKKK